MWPHDELPPGLEGGLGQAPGADLPLFSFDFSFSSFFDAVVGFFTALEIYLVFLSVFLILFIIYLVVQRSRVLIQESKQYEPSPQAAGMEGTEMPEARPKLTAFDQVKEHMDTDNPTEWRMAIIEADNILYNVLNGAGYEGETLGEMLTNASRVNFATLENAWEAHKIRNMVAHEGPDATLDKREAKRVVSLFESVFREFDAL